MQDRLPAFLPLYHMSPALTKPLCKGCQEPLGHRSLVLSLLPTTDEEGYGFRMRALHSLAQGMHCAED